MSSMNKGLVTLVAIALIILAGGIFLAVKIQNSQTLPPSSNYEYYWGDGCPHCAKVAEFFNTWDKKDVVAVDKKEIWNNQANYNLMLRRAKSCGLNQNQIGVPFLFTPDGKCLTGDEPIIDFFKNIN